MLRLVLDSESTKLEPLLPNGGSTQLLQFLPFASTVNVSFWYELSKRKLDIVHLKEDPLAIWGSFSTEIVTKNSSQFYVEGDGFFPEHK